MKEVRKVKAHNEDNIIGITAICESRGKKWKRLEDNVVEISGENLQGVIDDIKMRLLGLETN